MNPDDIIDIITSAFDADDVDCYLCGGDTMCNRCHHKMSCVDALPIYNETITDTEVSNVR